MEWSHLNSNELFDSIREKSYEMPQIIFKHSTSCGISARGRRNMEKFYNSGNLECHIWEVYVIEDRDVSQSITYYFNVPHKSPQVILINKGEVQWHFSHFRINEKKLNKEIARIQEEN